MDMLIKLKTKRLRKELTEHADSLRSLTDEQNI